MEEAKPVKGRKKLHSADKINVGVNEPEKKLVARNKIDKPVKRKAMLPRVRSQSFSPHSVAGPSRIREPKHLPRAGNKTDKVVKKKEPLPSVRSQSASPPSVAGTSRIREPKHLPRAGNQTDKVAISKVKSMKPKDTGIVKANKSTVTAKKTKAVGTAKKTKTMETAKKTKAMETDKKTGEDVGKLNSTFEKSRVKVSEEKSVVGNKIPKTELTVKKLKLIEDVYEAIVSNGQPRKGTTSQAIKSYIISKRGAEAGGQANVKRLNTLVNNALRKGMEDGTLQRPTTSKENGPIVSAAGRFVLSHKVVKPKVSVKLKVKKYEGSETME